MAARDPSRPKAAQIPLVALLDSVHRRDLSRLEFPAKVIGAKLLKVEKQGLVEFRAGSSFRLTPKGQAKLQELRCGDGGGPTSA